VADFFDSGFVAPPVMLLASLPEEDEGPAGFERSLEIQEAVLSFGRAAFSRGHQVAVPDDEFVAPLLAAVAEEYREPTRSEEVRIAPPQLEIGRIGSEDEDLSGWSRRPLHDGVRRGDFGSFAEFLESARPRKAIAVGGGGRGFRAERVEMVRKSGIELQAIAPTLTVGARERGWGDWDATEDLLREIDWPRPQLRERGEDASPPGAEGVVPYAYLMERLVEPRRRMNQR
jgi:hypothetical protein